ncbi:hypothetical protein Y032_0119g819 [Ancylostoma ceylanicum]|uniref:Uncharacterized protein n=1 Tax=Ancylostoma ceylanicum TaxID=53326 RepID=A0A016TB43_9BILA|nr:hypothetical protein Y032_0119g819 [Ancylostoma ceylanicum]
MGSWRRNKSKRRTITYGPLNTSLDGLVSQLIVRVFSVAIGCIRAPKSSWSAGKIDFQLIYSPNHCPSLVSFVAMPRKLIEFPSFLVFLCS